MNDIVLTVILPTCEPDSMFEFLLPTIWRVKDLNKILEFNITFQPPYNNEQIKKVIDCLEENGFNYHYQYKDYKVIKPYTPLIKMRNDCALMSPKSDYYLVWDDDISIESSDAVKSITTALTMLTNDSNLCAVSLYNQGVENHRENFYSTNAGLIVRGGKYYGFDGYMPESLLAFGDVKTLVPYEGENLINLYGGFQDKFGVMCRLSTGQTGYSLIGVPINHVENRKQRGAIAHGWDAARFENGSIAAFILKYFNPSFLDTHSLGLFNKRLDRQIYPYKYDENGNKKLEYNLFDDRGFAWWFNYNNMKLWYLEDPEQNKSIFIQMVTSEAPLRVLYEKDEDFKK